MSFVRLACVALLSVSATLAAAAPVQWSGNGHYYDYIPDRLSWSDANADAQTHQYNGMTGYLATITSQEEEDFFYSNPWLRDNLLYGGPWIGAFRTPDSDIYTGWQWVTGEAWGYTHWRDGEPNNSWPTYQEYFVHYLSTGVGGTNVISGWNDHPDATYLRGYFIEYSVPEPGTVGLLGIALLGAAVAQRKGSPRRR